MSFMGINGKTNFQFYTVSSKCDRDRDGRNVKGEPRGVPRQHGPGGIRQGRGVGSAGPVKDDFL